MSPAQPSPGGQRASVVLPTYNEREGITPLIAEVLRAGQAAGHELQVVVVDDDSPDGTAQAVAEAFAGDPRVKLVVRRGERGLASAVLRGIREAGMPVVALMDSDFNHHPRDLMRLLESLPGWDMVLGSRYVPGGGMKTSRLRWLGSYAFNLYLRWLLGLHTRDNLSGFLVASRETLLSFDPAQIFFGYGDYAIRLLYEAQQRGLRIRELPVVYDHRQGGRSKTNLLGLLPQYTKSGLALRRQKRP
ncbi:MAG: glycosyltransferase [Thermodesulfobacteriota bacterium]